MSIDAYALVGLTALIGALVFAVLRFIVAARAARRSGRSQGGAGALMSDAVQEAVARLRHEERQAAARADASQRLSDQVISSMRSGLLLIDADGRLRIVNAAARRLIGLTGDPPVDVSVLLAPMPPFQEAVAAALGDGRPRVHQTIRCPGGAATHLSLTVSPVHHPDGGLQSLICLFDDVSTVVALGDQLRLKDSLAKVGELTAGIAHEFRNGLATIHGYARLMDPAALPQSQATCVNGIRAETEALGQVVTNFLNFARPTPLTLTRLDLRAVVGRAADDIRRDVEAAGGRVEVEGAFPDIDGDEVLLKQAFGNLCRNAAEACAVSGHPALIRLVGRTEGDDVCHVAVSDNGPGLDPAVADRLFQPFITTRARGTGLGLAIVQKIVVTHNGRVTASTPPAGGALFEVVLPLRQGVRL